MRGEGDSLGKGASPLPLKLPSPSLKLLLWPLTVIRDAETVPGVCPPAAQKRPVSRRYGAFLCHPEEYMDEA